MLTSDDVAKRWGVHPQSVRRARTMVPYEGPSYVVVGKRAIRYRLQDLEAYEQRQLVGAQ